jgi:hypothetical protein
MLALGVIGWYYCAWENKQRDLGRRDHRASPRAARLWVSPVLSSRPAGLDGLDAQQIGLLGSKHPQCVANLTGSPSSSSSSCRFRYVC